jgi:hypothetical protein
MSFTEEYSKMLLRGFDIYTYQNRRPCLVLNHDIPRMSEQLRKKLIDVNYPIDNNIKNLQNNYREQCIGIINAFNQKIGAPFNPGENIDIIVKKIKKNIDPSVKAALKHIAFDVIRLMPRYNITYTGNRDVLYSIILQDKSICTPDSMSFRSTINIEVYPIADIIES